MKIFKLNKKVQELWGIVLNGIFINEELRINCGDPIDGRAFLYYKGKGEDEDIGKHLYSVERFAHLHCHSAFSMLDGMAKVEDIAKYSEHSIVANTDHGVMFGSVAFQKAMKKNKKKGIIGCEFYIMNISLDADPGNLANPLSLNRDRNHIIVIAKDIIGYKNMLKLMRGAEDNFYKKPHISLEALLEHKEGLIILSGCLAGEIPRKILQNKFKEAEYIIKLLKSNFGEDFYLEIQNHSIPEEKIVRERLKEFGRSYGVKLVATLDTHYINKDDAYAHEILLCIGTKKQYSDPDRFKMSGEGYHLQSNAEIFDRFKGYEDAIFNTLEVAEKCNFEFETGNYHMPQFDIPEEFSSEDEYMLYLCREGFKSRFSGTPKFKQIEYANRMKMEIATISRMGYSAYFLIVADFINWAKSQGILIGPGRGSAVGSLVSYVMGIVDMDPIEWDLYFERFLNPDRVSMPDIDIDIQDDKRHLVLAYIREKYGSASVSKIVAIGTMGARVSFSDVARVLGEMSSNEVKKLTKTLPAAIQTLDEAAEIPEFKSALESDPRAKAAFDIAKRLEGIPRQASQHACGILIVPGNVSDFVPEKLMEDPNTGLMEPTAQFNMVELEELGLLKMDLLSLRTLTVIGNTCKMVNSKSEETLSLETIPIDDKETYEFISEGKLTGTFQLESSGMQHLMKDLYQDIKTLDDKKEFFERIVAGISLYRPGPMDYIPDFVRNMKNPDDIVYEHPVLAKILKNTYGVITYQEQVMAIVRELAGYSLAEADNIRRIMGKKKIEAMNAAESDFLKGCENNNVDAEIALVIWNKMVAFAKYAFNRSHSCGYADIAVKTAYLKCHHPSEYMCATLDSNIGKSDKLKRYLSESKKMGIEILFPDVNRSTELFSVDKKSIRYGLSAIKGVNDLSNNIIKERDEKPFESFQDFIERMMMYKFSSDNLKNLIFSGALDTIEKDMKKNVSRRAKEIMATSIVEYAKKEKFYMQKGIPSLFTDEFSELKRIPIVPSEEYSISEKLKREYEANGLYIKNHPVDQYSFLRNDKSKRLDKIEDIVEKAEEEIEMETEVTERYVSFVAIIKDIKARYTKSSEELMYTLTLEDETGEITAVMFPQTAQTYPHISKDGILAIFKGKVTYNEDFGLQMGIYEVIEPSRVDSKVLTGINVQLKNKKVYSENKDYLKSTKSPLGPVEVKIIVHGQVMDIFNIEEKSLEDYGLTFGEDVENVYN